MTRLICFILILFIFYSLNLNAQNGWLIVEQSGDTTYLLKGTFMSVWENRNFILDADKNEMTFINHNKKIYSKTSLDDYCKLMTTRAEEIKSFMYNEQIDQLSEKPEVNKSDVEIIKVGPAEKIAGFNTTKYNIMVDGNLYEEVWITNDPSLMDYYTTVIKSLTKMYKCLTQMTSSDVPENTPEYRIFMEEGFALKNINHSEYMSDEKDEIKLLEKRTIEKNIFNVPIGYQKVTLDEFLQFQVDVEGDENWDDDLDEDTN